MWKLLNHGILLLVGVSDFHWPDAVIPNAKLSANPAAHYIVENLLIVDPQEKLSASYGLQVICDFPTFSAVSVAADLLLLTPREACGS